MNAAAPSLNQPRELAQILGDSFRFFGRDWRAFVTIGAASIPFSLLSSGVQLAIEDAVIEQLVVLAVFLASILPLTLIEGAVIVYLRSLDTGPATTEANAFKDVWARRGALFGAIIRMVAVLLPLFLLIVPLPLGIYHAVRWLFAPHVVMLEGLGGKQALDRSAELVQGNWWRTLGRMLAVSVCIIVLNLVILSLIASGPTGIYILVSGILGAFTTPFFSIALTLMYFDLKSKAASTSNLGPR